MLNWFKNIALMLVVPVVLVLSGCTNSEFYREDGTGIARYANRTIIYYDDAHGVQVEYYSSKGKATLWYPGNRRIVQGLWKKQKPSEREYICFRYKNSYNPLTGLPPGRGWQCTLIKKTSARKKYACNGDVFNLANSTQKIPRVLKADKVELAQLKKLCGGKV